MEYLNTPYLCGGVVITLIVLVKSKGTPRKRINGDKDFNSNPNIMLALEKAIDPMGTYFPSSTHDKDTSHYLNCKDSSNSNALALNSAPCAQLFDNEIKKQNSTPVCRVAEFLDMYLPENYRAWFLKAVLEILEFDPSISEQAVFYIYGDGTETTKAQIREMNSFCLEAFVTGIIHFILTHRIGSNHLGADTIEICKLKKLNECQLGRGITRDISLIPWVTPQHVEAEPTIEKTNTEMSDGDVIVANAAQALRNFFPAAARIIHERADEIRNGHTAEVEPEAEPDGTEPEVCHEIPKQEGNQVTYIQHQTNVYQNAGPGGKNIHIEHVDKLEL